jgi:hypothetical protein
LDASSLQKLGIPVIDVSPTSANSSVSHLGQSTIQSSTLFSNEFQVIERYCDYRNANECGYVYRLPKLATSDNNGKVLCDYYAINDPLKAVMTPGGSLVRITTCQEAIIKNTFSDEICKAHKMAVTNMTMDTFSAPAGGIVDFGDEIQHFSASQLYAAFSDNKLGVVGCGYCIVPTVDDHKTHPITIGTKEIGLIRKLPVDGVDRLFVKVGAKQVGYKYIYLSGYCNYTLPAPNDQFTFTLELQQIDNYSLLSCDVKRYRIVKKPRKLDCFDAFCGDAIFDDRDDVTNAMLQCFNYRGERLDTLLMIL